ncbi:MAG TPA: chemotaxis protein CheD [Thermoanaerobaculia bacterium]|nr:chemotaxis protein CheD [Thermoanaerobaculia bacterium]
MTTSVALAPLTKFLQPGHLVVSAEPMQVTTILGSCIAVCLWDEQRRIGGMNHFMLPHYTGSGISSPRFGDVAMRQLVDNLVALGARPALLQARVFGGACMFVPLMAGASGAPHLGQKNADLALNFLQRAGVRPIQVETGGDRGRKVIFRTDEGTVCLKSI